MKKIFSWMLIFVSVIIVSQSQCVHAEAIDNRTLEISRITLQDDKIFVYENGSESDLNNEDSLNEMKAPILYTKGYKKTLESHGYGSWRSAVSGKGPATLSFTQTNSKGYNISYTASVSGEYSSINKINSMVGVTVGTSKTYSIGAGYSVKVPKGKRYRIVYRPRYKVYKIVETKYLEQAVPNKGIRKYPVSSKTCRVKVFDSWDFSYKAL